MSVDKLVKDRETEGLSFCPEMRLKMNAFTVIRGVVIGIFTVAKFIVISILRLGRWCWDRINLR